MTKQRDAIFEFIPYVDCEYDTASTTAIGCSDLLNDRGEYLVEEGPPRTAIDDEMWIFTLAPSSSAELPLLRQTICDQIVHQDHDEPDPCGRRGVNQCTDVGTDAPVEPRGPAIPI